MSTSQDPALLEHVPVSVAALNERVGIFKRGAARQVAAIAEFADGERFVAVAMAMWRLHSWGVVATDTQLLLARRPRIGRAETAAFRWPELTAARSESGRVDLQFGDIEVQLIGGPNDELMIMADLARRHLAGAGLGSGDELHELARATLGRLHSLVADSTVRRRRLLAMDRENKSSKQHDWEVSRENILQAECMDDGVRLTLRHGMAELVHFRPRELRERFVEALNAAPEE